MDQDGIIYQFEFDNLIQCECKCAKLHCNHEPSTKNSTDSPSEGLIKRYEYHPLQVNSSFEESHDYDSQENEILTVRLELQKANEQCRRLKTKLQAADKELTQASELWRAEKTLRLKVEIERDSLVCFVEKLELILLKYEQNSSSADKMVEFSALTNEKPTTELDKMIEHDSDMDWVLESPSPSIKIINNGMAEEIWEPGAASPPSIRNDSLSVLEEPVLSADTSVNTTMLSSPRTNASSKQPKLRSEYDFCGKSFLKTTDSRKLQCEENEKFTTAENMEKILSAETVACNQRTYNTRGSKEKAKLMSKLPKAPSEVRSAAIINNPPLYKKESSLRCDICEKFYATTSNLNQHKRCMHGGVKPYKCSNCDKTFVRKSKLKIHSAVHSSRRPFQCSVCKQSFKTTDSRNNHVRIVHGDAGFCCAHCNKKFDSKHKLIFHITALHLPELGKPYKCTTCSKSFIQKGHLKDHQAVHISETSHKCSMCEKNFKSYRLKFQHERRTHMEGFRFTCAHCERGFRDKRILGNHIQRLHL